MSDGVIKMKMRLFGGAMVLFGIAGAMASYGIWWAMYRMGESAADAAGGPPVECVHYCEGIGGPALTGLLASGGLAVVGLLLVVASFAFTMARD